MTRRATVAAPRAQPEGSVDQNKATRIVRGAMSAKTRELGFSDITLELHGANEGDVMHFDGSAEDKAHWHANH